MRMVQEQASGTNWMSWAKRPVFLLYSFMTILGVESSNVSKLEMVGLSIVFLCDR